MVVLAVGLYSAGTLAVFTDTASDTGNTITAGTMDLKIKDSNEGFADVVSATWVMTNMVPGGATVFDTVTLKDTGSIEGQHLEISFSYTGDTELAEWIEVTTISYDGINPILFLSSITDVNTNGWKDLEDLILAPNTDENGPLDDLPRPANFTDNEAVYLMGLSFRPEAPTSVMGKSMTMTVNFTLNQLSSQ